MFANRRALTHLAIGLLVCGAQACGQSKPDGTVGSGEVPAGSEGFEQTSFPLINAGCTQDSANQRVTFTMASGESLYMFKRAADGVVVANAWFGSPTVDCTFPTTWRVIVNGASGMNHKVLFDFISGSFGLATSATGGAGTNNGPNLVVNFTGGGTGNTVKIRGTSNWDLFTFGSITAMSTTTHYGSLNVGTATALAAARTFPDLSMLNVQNIVVAAGPGNDTITAQGGAAIGAGAPALDGSIGFDVYGGDGNDTIISGAASTGGASNNLYGNKGDDMFIQQVAKAKDNISGSDSGTADSDTLDYSLRTNPVFVTLGDDALAQVTSSGRINCVAKAMVADNDRFSINDGTTTKTFEYQISPLAASTGSIVADVAASYADNQTLVLNDGVHSAITFEFAASGPAPLAGGFTNGGSQWIDISGATTANDVADAIYAAIAAQTGPSFAITATDPAGASATVALSDSLGYNVAISGTAANVSVSGFTGGTHFAGTGGAITIDLTGVTTAAQVCTQVASVVTANIGLLTVTATQATPSDTFVTVAISPTGFKPAGAAITKIVGSAWTVVDFSAGTAFGSNDGETGEQDSINNDIENIIGGAGADTLDTTYSTLTTHILVGMAGADTLIGSSLADTLWGGAGDDILKGGAGVDIMNGGDGNDTLQGGTGSDTIDGGGLNCSVVPATQPASPAPAVPATTSCTAAVAAKGAAAVNPGINTLDYSDRGSGVVITADLTNLGSTATTTGAAGEKDIVALEGATGTPYSCQYLRGGAGNDVLKGDGRANIIWGGAGNDTIDGNGGDDAIYGEAGNDTIHGDAASLPAGQTAGNDYINTGIGTNTVFGDAGNDFIDDLSGTGAGSIDCGLGDSDVAMTSLSSTLACEL